MLIPFGGFIQAGFASPAQDCMEVPIDLSKELVKNELATFYVQATGYSMEGAHIPPGAILIVDKSEPCRNGSIIVAVIDGMFTVKRYEKSMNKVRLLPEHKDFQPINIHEFTDFRVWGVVTKIIIDAKTV